MDYKFIETLVISAKNGDTKAREKLIEEFKPFILNLSKRTFIDGYDLYDIQNECFLSLLNCLQKYKPENHRFVGFATNCIKNSIYGLIKKTKRRSSSEGMDALTFTGEIESIEKSRIDDELFLSFYRKTILSAVDTLQPSEKELLIFILLKHKTITEYAQYKNIAYSTAVNRKTKLCRKLNGYITEIN